MDGLICSIRSFGACCVMLLAGCSHVRPLAEAQHISHVIQHLGRSDSANYGANLASVGVRIRPAQSVTIDLLEGYSFEEMHGTHEVFTGRITVEF